MPNGTYGGVRGKETKVGQKTFVSRPTRLCPRTPMPPPPFPPLAVKARVPSHATAALPEPMGTLTGTLAGTYLPACPPGPPCRPEW